MKTPFKSTTTVKVGKVCSMMSDRIAFASVVMATALLGTLSWAASDNGTNDAQITLTLLAAIWTIMAISYVLSRSLVRERTINGETFTAEHYAVITDELRQRGISNTRRFIEDNPEYVHHAKELPMRLGWGETPAYRQKAQEMGALIYSQTSDPALTKDALISLITERGITDQKEARHLLTTMLNTESPLMSGAL